MEEERKEEKEREVEWKKWGEGRRKELGESLWYLNVNMMAHKTFQGVPRNNLPVSNLFVIHISVPVSTPAFRSVVTAATNVWGLDRAKASFAALSTRWAFSSEQQFWFT
ncbi:unnamed protein product [Clonostachys rosea]|uniref:Uncharacterized protein n=1 Tax=Bionectria ochroleuca TaxID=29856 RepID=A0ABY6UAI8_BIOOC|nr:unnamed protein product [Clonostachys rosea]